MSEPSIPPMRIRVDDIEHLPGESSFLVWYFNGHGENYDIQPRDIPEPLDHTKEGLER